MFKLNYMFTFLVKLEKPSYLDEFKLVDNLYSFRDFIFLIQSDNFTTQLFLTNITSFFPTTMSMRIKPRISILREREECQ